jgi:hypothetical protein
LIPYAAVIQSFKTPGLKVKSHPELALSRRSNNVDGRSKVGAGYVVVIVLAVVGLVGEVENFEEQFQFRILQSFKFEDFRYAGIPAEGGVAAERAAWARPVTVCVECA